MNGEAQVAVLALVFIVPIAIFWAFKTNPTQKSEKKQKLEVTDAPKKKDTFFYDQYLSGRYGKHKHKHKHKHK